MLRNGHVAPSGTEAGCVHQCHGDSFQAEFELMTSRITWYCHVQLVEMAILSKILVILDQSVDLKPELMGRLVIIHLSLHRHLREFRS